MPDAIAEPPALNAAPPAPVEPAPIAASPVVPEQPVAQPTESSPETQKGVGSLLSQVNVLGRKQDIKVPKAGEKLPEAPKPDASIRENFAIVETRAATAEKERDTLRQQLEAIQKERDEAKTQLTQGSEQLREAALLKQQLEAAQKELEQTRATVRTISVEHDPEFKARYDGGIQARRAELKNLAIASGSTAEQFDAAMSTGDEDLLATMRESLRPGQQVEWDAHRRTVADLAFERKQALANSQQTAAQIQQSRAEQARQQGELIKQQNAALVGQTIHGIKQEIPGLQNADPGVIAGIENNVRELVVNGSRDQIVKELALGQIRQQVASAQQSIIQQNEADLATKDAKISELEAKLAEQDQFIKGQAGSYPRGGIVTNGNGNGASQPGSLLSNVRVVLPGR